MTLFELFESYRLRKLMTCSDCTERKYRRAIRLCGLELGRMPLVEDLCDELVLAAMRAQLKKGRSVYTANDARSKLVALWSYAAKRGYCSLWPDCDRLAEPERLPTAWTRDQMAAVFSACNTCPRSFAGIPGRIWFRALLSVLWDTGERVGAVLQAKWIHFDGQHLLVPAAARKGRTRDKLYRLHPDTIELLKLLKTYGRGIIFDRDCTQQTVGNVWRRMLKAADLPHDRQHLFHCVRRSVATHATAAGGDACKLLDHSSSEITRRHYIDPRIVRPASAVDVLFRP